MPSFRIREAAQLLGISDDTLRRWADAGRVTTRLEDGRLVIDGTDLAQFAQTVARAARRPALPPVVGASTDNRFVGLVTSLDRDSVMAAVELHTGPYRVVSLMTREAADKLKLNPGSTAIVSFTAANVLIERCEP